jgi:uncharacterized membrane protein
LVAFKIWDTLPKKKYLVTGMMFFILALLIITFSGIRPLLFPAQEDQAPGQYTSGQIMNIYLLKQPFFLKKDWLTGVEVLLSNPSRIRDLDNMLLILDENNRIIYNHRFSSNDIYHPVYYPFRLNKSVKVGKGHQCSLVIYSINGDPHSSIGVGLAPLKQFNPLTAIPLQNNDVINSLNIPGQTIDKSICFRTFETNSGFFSGIQVLLYLLTILVTLAIIFFDNVKAWLFRVTISPERVYLPIALVSGLSLVFIVPPFQVPDEYRYFYRSYEVSEFNIFQSDRSIPKSLTTLYSKFARMDYRPYEKTSPREIRSMSAIKLHPEERESIEVTDLVLPFIPQATGMFIGKICGLAPIWLFYLGRIASLIVAVFLVFLSIRTTPVLKLIFLLLGLMPMTVYLFSSFSYDVLTISLSFLLIAKSFNLAFSSYEKIKGKDIIIFFLIAFMLALCKPPYYILASLFLLIPVRIIGSLKRYLILIFALVILVFAGSNSKTVQHFIQSSRETAVSNNVSSSTPATPNGLTDMTPQPENFDQPKLRSSVDPEKQKQFILENPLNYGQILFSAVFIYWRSFYLETFIGNLGWLDLPLPSWLIYSYLLVLVLVALGISTGGLEITPRQRFTGLGVFFGSIILLETAVYILWTPVGFSNIEGAQGRYFIPLAPLFFLGLINSRGYKWLLNLKLSSVKKESIKAVQTRKTKKEYILVGPIVINLITVFILCFVLLSLMTVTYEILNRFFIILV